MRRARDLVPDRVLLGTLSSFAVAQAILLVASLLRIPIIVDGLGVSGYGLVIAVAALIPILLIVAAGNRSATRVLIGEHLGAAEQGTACATAAALARKATRTAAIVAVVSTVACWVLPVTSLFQASGVEGWQVRAGLTVSALLAAGSYRGSVWFGALEGAQRTTYANWSLAYSALIGLPAVWLINAFDGGFVLYVAANALAATAPLLAAPVMARTVFGPVTGTPNRDWARQGAVTRRFTTRALAEVAVRGVDPIIVAGVVGSAGAATYGVVQRISLVTTSVPVATAPLMNARYSQRKGSGEGIQPRHLVRVVALYGAVSLIAGTVLVLIGPSLATWLLHGASTPVDIFIAFGVLGVVWATQVPLTAAAVGPAATRMGVRIDLAAAGSNLLLSIVLAFTIGVSGPVWASSVVSLGVTAAWAIAIVKNRSLLTETHRGGVRG